MASTSYVQDQTSNTRSSVTYVTERNRAEEVVVALAAHDVLAFDLETTPAFYYPRERKKTDYQAYYRWLQRQRWGLAYAFTPNALPDPLPPPVRRDEEIARVNALILAERAKKRAKKRERLIADYEAAIEALCAPAPPSWALPHVARLLATGTHENDPVRPGLDPHTSRVVLMQFATRQGDVYCFNVAACGLDIFIPLFERVALIGANLVFDAQFVMHAVGIIPCVHWDVLVADRVLTLGLPFGHSLKDVAERWLGVTLDKTTRETFATSDAQITEAQIAYAAEDVAHLFAIAERQAIAAEKLQMRDAVEIFNAIVVQTAAIEYCGLKVDTARWLQTAEEAERRLAAAADELAAYLGLEPNDLAKRDLVLERARALGVPLASLDRVERDETRRKIDDATPQAEFFKRYDAWSVWQKSVTTYGRAFLSHVHPITGRIHPRMRIAGADTGRFTSNAPNILNLPRGENGDVDYRSAFVAPAGFVFGNADYSAMEQRIAADLSRDPALVSLFAAGGDNHSVTAALMFHTHRGDVDAPQETTFPFRDQHVLGYLVPRGWSVEQLIAFIIESGLEKRIAKEYKRTTRQVAKVVAFLYFYGGTPAGLAKKLHCQVAEAEQFFRDFQAAYPTMTRWFKANAQSPTATRTRLKSGVLAGYVATYAGLRRWFTLPDVVRTKEEERAAYRERAAISRQAMNFPCQGGNAVVMARAMAGLWRVGLPREGEVEATLGIEAMVVAPIYDEALVLLPASTSDEDARQFIAGAMTAAGNAFMNICPVEVDVNPLADTWRKF